jgi:hypothetical protein
VDSSRNAYVTGYTNSTESQGFPVTGGPDLTQNGSADAFVVKIAYASEGGIYVSSSSSSNASDISVSWTHVVDNVSNRLLVVGVSILNASSQTVSTVTWNSTGLTQVTGGSVTNSTNCSAEMWYLVNPAVGVYTITVTLSASASFTAGAITFGGVNQSTPFGTFASATGSSAAPSVNASSASGEMVVDVLAAKGNPTATAGAGQTRQWHDVYSTTIRGAGSTESGATTVTMSYTLSAKQQWAIGAVGLKPSNPTAVSLVSFQATEHGNGPVLLRWQTGFEVNNLGFHVYREEGGQLYRLTPELIAGSALVAGGGTILKAGRSYTWWNLPTEGTDPVPYWLEDVDLNGKRTWHGPVVPARSRETLPEQDPSVLLSGLGKGQEEKYGEFQRIQQIRKLLQKSPPVHLKGMQQTGRSNLSSAELAGVLPESVELTAQAPSPAASRTQRALAGRPAMKIGIREEGWYRVTQPELVAAGLNPGVNPRRLRLFVDGQEQAILVTGGEDGQFGPQDGIEFYGVGLDTPFTDTRVYWLVEGSGTGKRIKTVSNRQWPVSDQSFPYTVQRKDRMVYIAALKNGDAENFVGAVIAKEPVDQILGLPHVDRSATGEALLEVALQGLTAVPHRLKLSLNGVEIEEIAFDGQAHEVVKVAVPQQALMEEDNLLTFSPKGGETDVSAIDYVRLTYWHTYTADSNLLRFVVPQKHEVIVDGFTNPGIRVMDITTSAAVKEVLGEVEGQGATYAVRFGLPGNGQRALLAFTEEQIKQPAAISFNLPSAWYQGNHRADLVIIGYGELMKSLEPLKDLRESQGLSVELIDVEDIYDEFSFGAKTPEALKEFLRRARTSWKKRPRYVLLVGDASFDPRNYMGLGEFDLVPTKLVDTAYLETASDDWFVDFNGDGLPEMAVGRLPVRTAQEAATVVSKLVDYERIDGMDEALIVADTNDGFDFEAAGTGIEELLPSIFRVRKIFRGEFESDELAKEQLLNSINQGPLLVNYTGHGSEAIWRGNLLTSEDTPGLSNGPRLPFFIAMTCFNGFFHDIFMDSLAEALLKARQGGAVAVWASSGLTEPDGQIVMNRRLIQLLFDGKSKTVGQATAEAKGVVSDQDIRRTWIFFGDPTTRLK